MNDYYVYEHIRNDNNSCFYVGKGHGNRAYSKNRNEHHDRIVKKYGMTVNIVKDNLSEEEAYKFEHELICDYVFNKGYGIDSSCISNIKNEIYRNQLWKMKKLLEIQLNKKEFWIINEDFLLNIGTCIGEIMLVKKGTL